jgi:hypothetical protein
MSQNPMGLHGLLQGQLYLCYFTEQILVTAKRHHTDRSCVLGEYTRT